MKAKLSFLVWTLIITFLSLTPVYEPSTYKYFMHEDKVAHYLMYLIMACLLGFWTKPKSLLSVLWVFLITAFYGYLMEILQKAFVTGRMFDYFDILANIFGSFTGTMLIYMLYNRKR